MSKMTKLTERNYTLISKGIKSEGSYNPDEIFMWFEEDLFVHESKTIYDFLEWCHKNEKQFGRGNYEERFQEFLNDTDQSPQVDRGAATIIVDDNNGRLLVSHTDGTVLLELENVVEGTWDKLWEFLREIQTV